MCGRWREVNSAKARRRSARVEIIGELQILTLGRWRCTRGTASRSCNQRMLSRQGPRRHRVAALRPRRTSWSRCCHPSTRSMRFRSLGVLRRPPRRPGGTIDSVQVTGRVPGSVFGARAMNSEQPPRQSTSPSERMVREYSARCLTGLAWLRRRCRWWPLLCWCRSQWLVEWPGSAGALNDFAAT